MKEQPRRGRVCLDPPLRVIWLDLPTTTLRLPSPRLVEFLARRPIDGIIVVLSGVMCARIGPGGMLLCRTQAGCRWESLGIYLVGQQLYSKLLQLS